jgi:ribose transport system substrate-binding protein
VIDGRIDVTYVYPTGGQEAVDWAVKILDGEQPPREIVLDTIEMTSENAEEVYAQFGGQ